MGTNDGLANINNAFDKEGYHALSHYDSHSKAPNSQKIKFTSSVIPLIHKYNTGDHFTKTAKRIYKYRDLVIGQTYHIGTGDIGNHAFYFTAIFVGIDENGNAVFKDYSQLNKNGNKKNKTEVIKIKPIQKGPRQRHIYELRVMNKLPMNVKKLIRSFGNKPTKKRSGNNLTKKDKRSKA